MFLLENTGRSAQTRALCLRASSCSSPTMPPTITPYGLRLLSRCLWAVSFKRGGVSFYARFVERHGMPWVVGKAPSQVSEEDKRKIARGLSRMVQDAVAVVPFGAEVKLESAGQTQGAIRHRAKRIGSGGDDRQKDVANGNGQIGQFVGQRLQGVLRGLAARIELRLHGTGVLAFVRHQLKRLRKIIHVVKIPRQSRGLETR